LPFDPWALPTAIQFHVFGVNTRSLPLPVLTSLPTAIQFHAFGVMMAGKRNFSWTICRIPARPFDYMVKAGQPARPKTKK
jgi:hypothetical protein